MNRATPNHTVDNKTGFVESKGQAWPFDAEKKERFIQVYVENGLGFYKTCDMLGMFHGTVAKHLKIDPAFKEAMRLAEDKYIDELETISRSNARLPKSVIERIFQLKALRPEKYNDAKRGEASPQITINLNGAQTYLDRQKAIDAEVIADSKHSPETGHLTQNNATNGVKIIDLESCVNSPTEGS